MEAETITIVGTILGSSLMTIALLLRQMNHLETKLTTKIAGLDTRLTGKIEAMDTRFTDKIEGLGTKITALDGKVTALDTRVTALDTRVTALDTKVTALDTKVTALDTKVTALDGKFDVMGRDVSDSRERLARVEGHLMAPEGFRMRGLEPPSVADPPPTDPGVAQRAAG